MVSCTVPCHSMLCVCLVDHCDIIRSDVSVLSVLSH